MAVSPLRDISVVYMVITVDFEGEVGLGTLERRIIGSFPESQPSRCRRSEEPDTRPRISQRARRRIPTGVSYHRYGSVCGVLE